MKKWEFVSWFTLFISLICLITVLIEKDISILIIGILFLILSFLIDIKEKLNSKLT